MSTQNEAPIPAWKRPFLMRRRQELLEEYTAVYVQISWTLNEADIVRLKRQGSRLEDEIDTVERDLQRVSSAPTDADTTITPQSQLSLLADKIAAAFNEEDVKNLCFRIDVDYDELAAQGKSGKIRELVLFLERRQKIPTLIKHLQALRPQSGWLT